MGHLVSPSLLSADFLHLQRDFDMLNESEADYVHLDVMDGVFVPNISFGMPIVKAAMKASKKPLDVHLMIVDPDRYVEEFKKLGADILSVHTEACTHLHRTVQHIKGLGMKAGVALNPSTPISSLEEIIKDIDVVMLMSVNPGFGGQKYIANTTDKVRRAKKMINESGSKAIVEVDGGVNYETGEELLEAGADMLVAGSFVFGAENPKATIAGLKAL